MSRIWSAVVEGLRRVASLSDRPGRFPVSAPIPDPPPFPFENEYRNPRTSAACDRAMSFLRTLPGTGQLTERKGRLVAVFVTEFFGPANWDDLTPADLDLAMRLADGMATDAEREHAFRTRHHYLARALFNWSGVQAAFGVLSRLSRRCANWDDQAGTPGVDHFHRLLADPFPPSDVSVRFDPSWRTADAVAIADACHRQNDFSSLPVLGDLLEEAGCDDASILAHCRGPDTHVRGCWVVDLVLGKV